MAQPKRRSSKQRPPRDGSRNAESLPRGKGAEDERSYRLANDRHKLYAQIESMCDTKLLVYVTSDRPGLEAQIAGDVLDYFADHLDLFNLPRRITLFLYSRGGQTLAAWSIANLIRQFCEEFEVIIPSRAYSAATLIAIGADRIFMTKQAQLGPVDPSVNGPLNPSPPGHDPRARVPVSVEAVAGYMELARKEWGITGEDELKDIFLKLSDHVHPIALGDVYRARTQIQRLARSLLSNHMSDENQIEKVISVLCSESGSHDYTITRREARDELGLPVEVPTAALYELVDSIQQSIRRELELNSHYDPGIYLGAAASKPYSFTRGLVESLDGGSHKFVATGKLTKGKLTNGEPTVFDERTFEGWQHTAP